jgi:diadenosine tetraphosphatase ApaH/serine/threonine PP2A family protein phosphatase
VLAVLYDVHGNLPALEAVVADARAAGADRWLLGGDYAGLGAWPEETVAALRGLEPATWLRGNWERWAISPQDAADEPVVRGGLRAVRDALGPSLVAELGALPEQTAIEGTRYCHASPVSDMRPLLPEPGDDEDELLAGVTERRLVFGHTHLAFRRSSASGIELFNPGSVGLPFDGDPRAAYALAHDDGALEHRRVTYDHAASAAKLRERYGTEWADSVAGRLERGAP